MCPSLLFPTYLWLTYFDMGTVIIYIHIYALMISIMVDMETIKMPTSML